HLVEEQQAGQTQTVTPAHGALEARPSARESSLAIADGQLAGALCRRKAERHGDAPFRDAHAINSAAHQRGPSAAVPFAGDAAADVQVNRPFYMRCDLGQRDEKLRCFDLLQINLEPTAAVGGEAEYELAQEQAA